MVMRWIVMKKESGTREGVEPSEREASESNSQNRGSSPSFARSRVAVGARGSGRDTVECVLLRTNSRLVWLFLVPEGAAVHTIGRGEGGSGRRSLRASRTRAHSCHNSYTHHPTLTLPTALYYTQTCCAWFAIDNNMSIVTFDLSVTRRPTVRTVPAF